MRHGSLFSGIGGFDLAAQWMGWENVFQVEWDKWCQKVLAKNFPDTLRFGDIVEFNKMLQNGEIITDTDCDRRANGEIGNSKTEGKGWEKQSYINEGSRMGYGIGRIDLITGGFPCQPFSHAGKRKGVDDSRYLWPEMLTTIRILKPSFVIGENVAGLVSMENGKTLDRILSDLANEGYTTEQFIIPACAVGAWHRRDRIWIIGVNTNHNTIRCNNGECATKEGSKRGCESFDRYEGLDKDVSDGNGKYGKELLRRDKLGKATGERTFRRSDAQTGRKWKSKSNVGGMVARLPIELDGYWDREPEGIPRVAIGIKDRVNRLKGLGNAIVPQVAFEIFKAIELLITSA
jgi:DNA (cytosine-5)-methyltransferase 1